MKNGMYDDLAEQIWKKDKQSREQRIRWHNSNHHIEERSLDVSDLFEDVVEFLDIEPRIINISQDIWQINYMTNPLMIAAMAKVLYNNLKEYNRFSFDVEPNWITEAKKYKMEVLSESF